MNCFGMQKMLFGASFLVAVMVVMMNCVETRGELDLDYYSRTCPNVERIIFSSAQLKLAQSPTTAAAIVRLLFHDCFIEGCDASIMITSTPDNVAERDAEINMDLAGDAFDAVVRAKAAVEAECPRVVSCADVMAIATRDFILLTGGPTFPVFKGRKDGLVSKASRVRDNIPEATLNLGQLVRNFRRKGLSRDDLVTLSGAHTFGFAHCVQFSKRLYNYNSTHRTDPRLDPGFAQSLKGACPRSGVDPNLVEPFDPSTPFSFDNSYYQTLRTGNALLNSDQALVTSRTTRRMVDAFASDQAQFYERFGVAMQKLSGVEVKTGGQGNVRLDCTKFN